MADRVATQMFPAQRDGQTVIVLRGARFPADHPIVKANPTRFLPAPARRRTKTTPNTR